jgi:ATP-dependent RNA helicase DHX8/PRP22
MVHISKIQSAGRVNHPSDLLSRGQPVKVKVMSIASNRISLSMADVDQVTGRDLTPELRIKSEAELAAENAARFSTGANGVGLGGHSAVRGRPVSFADDNRSRVKRLTSPERWEIKQLIASGYAKASDYPDLDEDVSTPIAAVAEAEEDVDIEVKEDEAPFLAGQAKRALELSPIKIVKAPDGTLNRAALAGASLAKERKELRQQEVNEQADSETRDLSTPWNDPMAQSSDRLFAQDARGSAMGRREQVVPAWRKETINKATSFGRITSLSIQEQRQQLPVYKFRELLMQAVRDVWILDFVPFGHYSYPSVCRTRS